MDRIKTTKGEAWVEGAILMMKLSGDITVQDIEEIANAGMELATKSKNVKYNLVDISGVRKVPLSARQSAFEKFGGPAKKLAFVCRNPVSRIIVSFFLRRYKVPMPIKVFSDSEEGKIWLVENDD